MTPANRQGRAALRKSAEIAWAAPQVVAHRMARMASAGASPSARDRAEFQRMGVEKVAAFQESWMAMGVQMMQMQQTLAFNAWRAWWMACSGRMSNPWAGLDAASLHMLNRGLEPVRRRAVSNARRLGRTQRKG